MMHAIQQPSTNWTILKRTASTLLKAPTGSRPKATTSLLEAMPPSVQLYAHFGRLFIGTFLPAQRLITNHASPFKHQEESKPHTPPTLVPEPPQAAPVRLVRPHHKLMSYNTENFVKTSRGKLIKPLESIQALSESILLENPDVIALQEVGDKNLLQEFNRKYLNNQYPNIICMPSNSPSDIRVAMMSKANMHVVNSKSHMKEMSQGAGYNNRRDFLETTFETASGFRFTVYNAHYKSMRGGEDKTTPVRMHEVRNAAKILKAHFAKDPKAPIFVTGDFNTLHNTPFGKPVLEHLTHLGDLTKKPMLTEVMMKDGKEDPTHNGKGFYPNSKLDYILTSNALLPQIRKAYVAGNFTQGPWQLASDHLPYVTEFEELTVPDKLAKKARAASDDFKDRKPINDPIAPHTPPLSHKAKRRKLNLSA